jgi:CPA1 family monovalent cation:H+ antiporter
VQIAILVTLVFQGLTLPWVIRKEKLEDKFTVIPEQEQERIIQKKIAQASLEFLEDRYGEERAQNEHLDNLFARLQLDRRFLEQEFKETNEVKDNSLQNYQTIYLEMLDRQRKRLNEMNRKAEFGEELIRKYLALIDVEEFKIREKLLPEKVSKN